MAKKSKIESSDDLAVNATADADESVGAKTAQPAL